MNKLKRLLWSDEFPTFLIIIWVIMPLVIFSLLYFLAGDKCQFIVDNKIYEQDCFFADTCKEVNNIECPKFVKTQYYTHVSLILGLSIILFVGAIWNAIRVFILSKSEKSWKTKLIKRFWVIVIPPIFLVLYIPYMLFIGIIRIPF